MYGIDINAVKEIDRNIDYTPVPDAAPHIVGLLNMRGQIVTLINLALLMGYEQAAPKERPACVILKNSPENPDYAGFIIDRPGSVIDVEDSFCEPAPANITSQEARFIREVARLDSRLIVIISRDIITEQ